MSQSSTSSHSQQNEQSQGSSSTEKDSLEYADQMKAEGNDYFRAGKWEDALAAYRVGLGSLPKRKIKSPKRPREPPLDDDDLDSKDKGKEREVEESVAEEPDEPLENDPYAKSRAVLNANIAACFTKIGDDKEVISACSEALHDDPNYVKALQRRVNANERIGSWSSLSSAQDDYRKLVDLLPEGSQDRAAAQRKLATIGPRAEEAQKRETAEMMDKLKGLGNSILGKFGISTDNFKFTPNGQGGYSMNFQQ